MPGGIKSKDGIFGASRILTNEEREQLSQIIEHCPVAVFQELNRRLNRRGFMIQTNTLPNAQRI